MFVDKYGLEFFKLPLQKMDIILKNTLENLPKIIELVDSQLPDEIKESFKPILEIEGVENSSPSLTPFGQSVNSNDLTEEEKKKWLTGTEIHLYLR